MADETVQDRALVRVWDPVVRIGHWVLVAGFAIAYITEGEPEWLHSWAGYAIAITVAARIVWGLIGPKHARFTGFVTGPAAVIAYLKDLVSGKADRHLGHSPAGGAMTVALLAMLALTTYSGMATLAAEEGEGPLAGVIAQSERTERVGDTLPDAYEREGHDEDEEHEGGESNWEEIHESAANITLFLIFLHIGGVLLASMVHRENLAHSMVTGDKRA
ncbi:cytochrome b [Rhodovulum iodosum]|uniref:Cytochrome b n=1 Tax=Rhodovulum iodosum TaxID=68291 RepID=A0ABV3XSN5_9RHOB|nr:cytochrome b/b6 domain-containing protein [Rhodovulum robiginosum]RSK30661.1 cytochrome B [Rhodovulum robiginosum]